MRNKTARTIRKFATIVWNNTPQNEQKGTLRTFNRNLKDDYYTAGVPFLNWIKDQLKKHQLAL